MKPALATILNTSRSRAEMMRDASALGVPRNYASTHNLSGVREPKTLVCVGLDGRGRAQYLSARAAPAWLRMVACAKSDAVEVQLVSAFRSADYQLDLLRRKLDRGLSIAEILHVNAAPGFSEHHSGRAIDVTTPGFAALEVEFEKSPAFAWLNANAQSFGFLLSYPRDNPHRIAYEPWHWCYHARGKSR